MPKVYDIVVGEALTKYHLREIYTDRIVLDNPIISFSDVVIRIVDALGIALTEDRLILPEQVIGALDELKILKNKVIANPTAPPDSEFRELLEVLSYFKYEVFLVDRVDLDTKVELTPETRAYLIDTGITIVPGVPRACVGWGMVFDIPEHASVPDVVMNFLESGIVAFHGVASDLLQIGTEIEKYNALRRTNSGYLFDVQNILGLLENYGNRIVIVANFVPSEV